jgi:copper chaperone CopZ
VSERDGGGRRGRQERVVFSVSNIECGTCALGLEKRLKKLDGVEGVRSAVMLNEVFVDYDASKVGVPEIMDEIKRSGYSKYVAKKR